MHLRELDFDLPPDLVATQPADPRDASRLLVVRASQPGRYEHRCTRELPELLASDDTLVFNATRVLPARLLGTNTETGGRVEGLYLRDGDPTPDGTPVWVVMLRARRFRPGRRVALHPVGDGPAPHIELELLDRDAGEDGAWRVAVHAENVGDTAALLAAVGRTPLPPYIRAARRDIDHTSETPEQEAVDRQRYQTVYAARPGSVAAPTAGLHFTPAVLDRLDAMGVHRTQVYLDVAAGTFKPVETERVEDHPMHAEWCAMDAAAREAVFNPPGRVVAVGSTSARTIESVAARREQGSDIPERFQTDLLITPGYRWRRVDVLLTNFHQPRSTLLAMVASLLPGGMTQLRAAYGEAIRERYRFFSYGDAMLVLP